MLGDNEIRRCVCGNFQEMKGNKTMICPVKNLRAENRIFRGGRLVGVYTPVLVPVLCCGYPSYSYIYIYIYILMMLFSIAYFGLIPLLLCLRVPLAQQCTKFYDGINLYNVRAQGPSEFTRTA